RAGECQEGWARGLGAVAGAARTAVEDGRTLFDRAFSGRAFRGTAGAGAIRRSAGGALCLVRGQHAGNGVRLPRDRRWFRHRDGLGRPRGAAPAYDLPRSRQCAGANRLSAVSAAPSKLIASAPVLRVRDVVMAANHYRDAMGFSYERFFG